MLETFKRRFLISKPEVGLESPVWFHCASVGEFNTALPLIKEVRKHHPVVLTYFSPRAESYTGRMKEFCDVVFPLPVDLPFLIRRFEDLIGPRVIVVLEREFWISLIKFTRAPKVLLNAYAKGSLLERYLSKYYSLIVTRTQEDAQVYKSYGCKNVRFCGNLKLAGDYSVKKANFPLPSDFRFIVAGSTHRGEEEVILEAFKEVRRHFSVKLVLAPRHISRAEEVYRLVRRFSLRASLRTEKEVKDWDVLILNTLGELRSFYGSGDLSVVGGTFVKVGGHNILEPALLGKPVIFGPHTHKIRDLEEIVIRSGYGFKVYSTWDLVQTIKELLKGDFKPEVDLKELSKKVKDCYMASLRVYL